MHLDREQVELALDAGLRDGSEAEQHLRTCSECQARLERARREDAWIRERLSTLDHLPPRITAHSVMMRASRARRSWERLAAGVVLALAAAGAAYAAPGSPLPSLIRWVVHGTAPTDRPSEAPPTPDARPSQSGIDVAPGDRLIIEFASPQPGDTAVVSLSDGSEVTVRASGGRTTFVSEPNRLIVRQSDAPARFELLVPQNAPWVTVTVGQRRLWLKAGARVDGSGVSGDGRRYVLPLLQKSPSQLDR